MFDIGILELGLIAVVALLVIGPERLPAVARTVGFWFGKVRRFVISVQEDFNRELTKSEELKKLLEEQSKIKDVHEIIEQSVDETRKTVSVSANLTPQIGEALENKNDADETAKQDTAESTEQPAEKKQGSEDSVASKESGTR